MTPQPSGSYLGIWLVFAWIIVPVIVGVIAWWHETRKLPPWLMGSARALVELDKAGKLSPHGIGGHARSIICEFIRAHGEKIEE